MVYARKESLERFSPSLPLVGPTTYKPQWERMFALKGIDGAHFRPLSSSLTAFFQRAELRYVNIYNTRGN